MMSPAADVGIEKLPSPLSVMPTSVPLTVAESDASAGSSPTVTVSGIP